MRLFVGVGSHELREYSLTCFVLAFVHPSLTARQRDRLILSMRNQKESKSVVIVATQG